MNFYLVFLNEFQYGCFHASLILWNTLFPFIICAIQGFMSCVEKGKFMVSIHVIDEYRPKVTLGVVIHRLVGR